MSQDLFAAFGSDKSSSFAVSGQSPSMPGLPNSSANALDIEDPDDDFGDFEDASAPANFESTVREMPVITQKAPASFPPKRPLPFKPKDERADPRIGRHPFADHMDMLFDADEDDYDAGGDELFDLARNPEAAMAYSKKLIAEQERSAQKTSKSSTLIDMGVDETQRVVEPRETKSVVTKVIKPPKNPDVLFDADDSQSSDNDDEDFGEFEAGLSETVTSSTSNVKVRPNVSSPVNTSTQPKLKASIHPQTKSDSNTGPPKRPSVPRQSTIESEEAWDDFDSIDIVPAPSKPTGSTVAHSNSQTCIPSTSPPAANESPPTNIPPPLVLLSTFAVLFASINDVLLNPLSRLDVPQRQELLRHQATHQLLQSFVKHISVLCRIIAGRRFRWKRDQFLAQGMRIGPAGGKSGMKLTGLDKSEATKEDREVVDTLHLWQTYAGRVRSAITTANALPSAGVPPVPKLPDVTEQMPVKVLKVTEGGLTAPHACALCGLKREERVAKVDIDVDDSFGEWWVDNMNMHTSCRSFWNEFKDKLKSR